MEEGALSMRRSFISTAILAAVCVIILLPLAALSADNATVTEDSVSLMTGPSFILDKLNDNLMVYKGQRIEVVSRTSFTDRLAAVPENYWYFVRFLECGKVITGYIHGSALAVNEGAVVPIFDPPGFSPNPPVVSGRYTVVSSMGGKQCVRDEGCITVPKGTAATHFVIARFDSSFTPCPDGDLASIIGFSIVSVGDPGEVLFSYEEHIADEPAQLQYIKDGFYYFDLEPGNYRVTLRGGGTVLNLTYELECR
jgi:hypothetical protein